ncbi:MAG TPA: hypothetical protein VHM92_09250 [Allosphingosinicella sp.]|nr:hypothetical protein [Allosphingosinicella sp.]
MRTGLIWAAALAAVAATATPAATGGGKDQDPNREVCKSRPVIGSRLQRVRECHTAQQWEEMKAQERAGLLRKQYNGAPGCPEGCQTPMATKPF